MTMTDAPAASSSNDSLSPWLGRFIWLLVVTMFLLIALGGTVTSKDAGLAVPDWPQTFGYNMFLYPPSKWVGGVFWEHTHRLLGSIVGLQCLILLGWTLLSRHVTLTMRILSGVLLLLVCIQGVMGGLRVTEISTGLAILHGINGQVCLCLTVVMAMLMTRPRRLDAQSKEPGATTTRQAASVSKASGGSGGASGGSGGGVSTRTLAYVVLGAIFLQLTLGAVMRHNRAALAIPDFPTAYGQLIPPLTSQGIRQAMDSHAGGDQQLVGYYSPFKVSVHFAHRLWAVAVVMAIFALISTMGARQELERPALRRLAVGMMALLVVQLALGALTIWTGRQAEVATAHQTGGAALMALATAMVVLLHHTPQDSLPQAATTTAKADALPHAGQPVLTTEAPR